MATRKHASKQPSAPDPRHYQRLKSSHGRFPVEGVEISASRTGQAHITFRFPDAVPAASPPAFDIESLACSLPSVADIPQDVLIERLESCALTCGPLLGQALPESALSWVCEVRIAQAALAIQRAINADAPLVSRGMPVVKSVVHDSSSEQVLFTSYCLSVVVGMDGDTALEDSFPRMPWMKRFVDDKSCDYAFVCCDTRDVQHVLDIYLVSFARDVPTVDYSYMVDYFTGLGLQVADADASDFASEGAEALSGVAVSEERKLAKTDIPHLQHLVHVLIDLHMQGARVDLFKSDGSKDFLAFDTYASKLWYDFAMRLGQVKVGYCVQCGKGFSLTGHRGIAKEYCSEACRTQAKNQRRRAQLARAREQFMEGATVQQIARDVYADMAARPAQAAVRRALKQWPTLKRAIEQDLQSGDGSLTRRCVEQGAVDKDFLARKANAAATRNRQNLSKPQG